jgi:2-polyprenyl-3-methyl-5-hydroxy-6-metoxy-1,4-benzoquinol methylase
MKNTCIICDQLGQAVIINGLTALRCPNCSLYWLCEVKNPEDYYYDKYSNVEDEKIEDRLENCRDRVKTFQKYISLDNLCDVGCGEGVFLTALESCGYKNVWGIEPNDTSIRFAKDKGLNVYQGELAQLPEIIHKNGDTRPGSISLLHVIEHLNDPTGSLDKIYNALDVGNYIIIETPNTDGYSIQKNNFFHKLVYPDHLFLFNERNLAKILEKTGFKVVAWGKRDFNPHNFSPKEIFLRLNIPFYGLAKIKSNKLPTERWPIQNQAMPQRKSLFKKIVTYLISRLGSPLVRATGRLDYIWMIGQK